MKSEEFIDKVNSWKINESNNYEIIVFLKGDIQPFYIIYNKSHEQYLILFYLH